MEDETQPKEVSLKVPWGFVAAKAYGSSQDYPVLVIHGLMDNAGSFNRLIPLLPKGFYYVCIDLPGHGLSSQFPSGVPLDYFNYVFCLRCVLKELGWKSCVCMAHSFGAMTAAFYTYFYPGVIKKMLAIEMIFPIPFEKDEMVARLLTMHESALEHCNSSKENLYSYEDVIYTLKAKRMHYLNTEAAKALCERAVTKVGNLYKYNRDSRLKIVPRPLYNLSQIVYYLEQNTVPILLIAASSTSTFMEKYREQFVAITKKRSNVDYVVVEGNHDVHNNHPERVATHVRRFLDKAVLSQL